MQWEILLNKLYATLNNSHTYFSFPLHENKISNDGEQCRICQEGEELQSAMPPGHLRPPLESSVIGASTVSRSVACACMASDPFTGRDRLPELWAVRGNGPMQEDELSS